MGTKTSAPTSAALLQEPREGTARGALELLGVDRAVIVGIGSVEAFLHEREKFILVQSSVVVGVGGSEILGVEPAAQFALVESAVVIAVELVEQLGSRALRFGEIDGAIMIRIERFQQALRPCRRGRDQRDGKSSQYVRSDAHVRVLRFDGDHIVLSLSARCAGRFRRQNSRAFFSSQTAAPVMSLGGSLAS